MPRNLFKISSPENTEVQLQCFIAGLALPEAERAGYAVANLAVDIMEETVDALTAAVDD